MLDVSAILLCEVHVAGFLGVKFLGPVGLEIDGVEQIHGGKGVELVKNTGNHAVGVGVAPLVDERQVTVFVEIHRIDRGPVILHHVGLVLRDEADAQSRVDIDAVGDFYRYLRVDIGGLLNHLLEEQVDFLYRIAQP